MLLLSGHHSQPSSLERQLTAPEASAQSPSVALQTITTIRIIQMIVEMMPQRARYTEMNPSIRVVELYFFEMHMKPRHHMRGQKQPPTSTKAAGRVLSSSAP
eukprot:TRINITY_DN6128_c0_g1_i1.p2 TRINITY_DN6128_c0_g1~~TRINITY_DN6128_c0_g1_i1.p2  ORF type:complete len:102 (-),score=5.81 TRINITY_DN6128_c0_g1_i1:127-432(-)